MKSWRNFAGFIACAIIAGGAVYWALVWALMPAPSAPVVAAGSPRPFHAAAQISPPQECEQTSDQLLADKPAPENGYSPEFDENVLAVVRRLLAQSPETALAWAEQTSDAGWRVILRKIVVQVWAESEPAAALAWARTQKGDGRETAIEAALDGLAHRPDVVVSLGQSLLADEPALADVHGTILLGALVRDGQFASAAQLADFLSADGRAEWMQTIYARWAGQDPVAASAALAAISDQNLYETAYRNFVAGWAVAEPQQVADYARTLSGGEFRASALQNAFDEWSRQDPAALAQWLVNVPPSSDFDLGAAFFLARSDGANRDTLTALAWAESIGTPDLRFHSVGSVLREWAGKDLPSAQNYAQTARWLSESQRVRLLGDLQN